MPRTEKRTDKSLGERLQDRSITDVGKRRFKVIMTLDQWAYVVRAIEAYPEYVKMKAGPQSTVKLRKGCQSVIHSVAGGKQV